MSDASHISTSLLDDDASTSPATIKRIVILQTAWLISRLLFLGGAVLITLMVQDPLANFLAELRLTDAARATSHKQLAELAAGNDLVEQTRLIDHDLHYYLDLADQSPQYESLNRADRRDVRGRIEAGLLELKRSLAGLRPPRNLLAAIVQYVQDCDRCLDDLRDFELDGFSMRDEVKLYIITTRRIMSANIDDVEAKLDAARREYQ